MKSETIALLKLLDNTAISAALRSVTLQEHEYTQVSEMVFRACERFLLRDLADWDDCATELRFETGHGTMNETHAFFDLVLWRDRSLSFDMPGLARVIDWKTAYDLSRPHFDIQTTQQWQTFAYLGPGADWLREHYGVIVDKMQYRCLDDEGVSILDVFPHPVPGRYTELSRQQNASTAAQFIILSREFSAGPWPRTLPFTCFKGAKGNEPTCPYWHDCINGVVPVAKESPKPPMSKSAWGSFLECPERYRRDGDKIGRGEGSLPQRIGLSFTNAIAEVYTQAFALKKLETAALNAASV